MQEIRNQITEKDREFKDVFFKRFAMCLACLIGILLLVYLPAQKITKNIQLTKLENELTGISLELAQLVDKESTNARMSDLCNTWFAKTQDKLESNGFFKNLSLSFYDVSSTQIVAKSFETPIILSEAAMNWWRERTGETIYEPKISLTNEMVEFCKAYEKKDVYISKMYELNGVLVPTKLVVVDNAGNQTKTCESHMPSAYEDDTFNDLVKIKLVGNRISDPGYAYLQEYEFVLQENGVEETSDAELNFKNALIEGTSEADNQQTEEKVKTYSLSYKKELNKRLTLDSKQFTINGKNYQLDCVYQLSFWNGIWPYVVAFEIIGCLTSAIVAYQEAKKYKKAN